MRLLQRIQLTLARNFMQSDSFCIRPFAGLEITSQGDFAPCCDYNRRYEGYNLKTHTIDEVLASEEVKQLKQSFLRGEKPDKCHACWRNEANGLDSQRLNSNRDYRYILNDIKSAEYSKIQALDLKMGITCNQMCVICDYGSSSMLKDESEAIFGGVKHIQDWTRDESCWDKLNDHMEHITRIDVYGGEPWLLKNHWKMIDRLIESGKSQDIHINYATNGSILDEKILERLQKFRKTSVLFSADGIQSAFEYNRYPGKWNVFEENLNTMRQFQNEIEFFAIAYTVSIYSVFNLRKSLEYYTDLGVKTWINPVNQLWYDPKSLPQKLKQLALEDLNKITDPLIHGGGVDGVINNINLPRENISHWREFKRITRMRDEMRNHHIGDFIPELKSYADEN